MRNPRFWIGLLLSVICLYFAFRDIQLAQLGAALSQASYAGLIPAVLVIGVAQIVRAHRWGELFYPDPAPPLSRLFSALSIGYLISTILPARLGDFVRVMLIGGRQGAKVAQSLSTVIVERALDVFSIIAILLFLLPFVSLPPLLSQSAITISVIFVVLSAGLWLAAWQRARTVRLIRWILGKAPRINPDVWTERIAGLLNGLAILRAPWPLFKVTLWSLVIWGVGGVLFNYLILRAFGLDAYMASTPRLLAAAAFVQVVVALGATVPSSPGYVGVYHAGVILALAAFGVPQADALAYALVSHAVNFGLIIVIGAIYLWREGLSIGQLTGNRDTVTGDGQES